MDSSLKVDDDTKCTKSNRPAECMECEYRNSLKADLLETTIECKYGTFKFNTGANDLYKLNHGAIL